MVLSRHEVPLRIVPSAGVVHVWAGTPLQVLRCADPPVPSRHLPRLLMLPSEARYQLWPPVPLQDALCTAVPSASLAPVTSRQAPPLPAIWPVTPLGMVA